MQHVLLLNFKIRNTNLVLQRLRLEDDVIRIHLSKKAHFGVNWPKEPRLYLITPLITLKETSNPGIPGLPRSVQLSSNLFLISQKFTNTALFSSDRSSFALGGEKNPTRSAHKVF